MIGEIRSRLGVELDLLSGELARRMVVDQPVAKREARDQAGADPNDGIQRRIRFLGQLLAGLAGATPTVLSADRIGYGSAVTIRDLSSGAEERYTLVTGEFIDFGEEHVSMASPLGNALLGCKEGERIVVTTPRGVRRYEIVALITLPQRLGIVSGSVSGIDSIGALQPA